MNDTKVDHMQIYTVEIHNLPTRVVTHADHTRIVAEKDAELASMAAHIEVLMQAKCTMLEQLAKYQRLHAADVGYDDMMRSSSLEYDTQDVRHAQKERRLAMEALK